MLETLDGLKKKKKTKELIILIETVNFLAALIFSRFCKRFINNIIYIYEIMGGKYEINNCG